MACLTSDESSLIVLICTEIARDYPLYERPKIWRQLSDHSNAMVAEYLLMIDLHDGTVPIRAPVAKVETHRVIVSIRRSPELYISV